MSTPPLIVPTPASAGAAGDDSPTPFTLDVRSILALLPDDDALDDWFLRFTAENDDLGYQFEIDEAGRLLAMASDSLDGAHRSMNILVDLYRWAEDGPGGMAVTGNALIRTLGWGRRAPDAGWIAPDQLEELPPAGQRPHGVPFTPRFIVEIVSRSNLLSDQQAKMEMWIASGAALGWLIDPFRRQAHIYRRDADPEILDDPETVSGDPVLPGFVFEVRRRVFDLTQP